MNDAIELIFYIFNKGINLFFNDLVLIEGVTLGWVLVSIMIFGILFNAVLNLPSNVSRAKYRQEQREYRNFVKDQYANKKGG